MSHITATKREPSVEWVLGTSMAILLLAVSSSSLAATAPQGATEVELDSSLPAGHFVEFLGFEVPYGPEPNDLGFAPAASDRQALGPMAFDVDASGGLLVADPVHQQILRIDSATRTSSRSLARWNGTLSEIAIDGQGVLWSWDARRGLLQQLLPWSDPLVLDRTALAEGFLRSGAQVFLRLPSPGFWLPLDSPRSALPGTCPVASSIQAVKAGAESALITFHSPGGSAPVPRILLQARKPLACVQLLGADPKNRAFVLLELFQRLGSLEVDRLVLVFEASGRIKAMLPVMGNSAVPLNREFVVAPDGALYRMLPGADAVRFFGWKVSP